MLKYKPTFLALAAFCCVSFTNAFGQSERDMAYDIKNAPFKVNIREPVFPAKTVNIKDFGAVGDGQTLNTDAINKAISSCSASGGGTVLIPAGLWLTGPIELKSNVNLHTEWGTLVQFSSDHSLFALSGGRGKPQLYGEKLENVAITGNGIFDGAGDTWRPLKKGKAAPTLWNDLTKSGGVLTEKGDMWYPTKEGAENDRLRPIEVSIASSKNVMIDGPTFKNSPNFAFNPKNINNLIIRNVKIENEYYAQNGDAIDLSSCKNAIVYHCTVHAGDDGICMKSSGTTEKGTAGLENIIIAENIVYHAHGGFVVGSNTDAGMNNIWVTNCNFVNTDIGIRIKSNKGRGGLVHNIFIDHIYMLDILNEAILFSSYYEDKAPGAVNKVSDDKTPLFQDFHMSDIYCNNAKTAISIIGLPDAPANHLYFSNIKISAQKAAYITEASDLEFKNVTIISPDKTTYNITNSKNIVH
jgi:polygalacturonase